ncbi:RadC family protein [Perlucidibaca piscinae]|uniref:RadC family protein n=1 Tax=Perlucidibaca piscinae TaxID=392589 RepID=UPI0003B530BB|nr:DNA repair protein RadC [Perlucidibaca piscinae]
MNRIAQSPATLMVRNENGRYSVASADVILEVARQVIDQKLQRGEKFSSPDATKDYLQMKLAGLEHEVFAVLFLDNQHRLIAYREMFRGTIDSASVHPREVVKAALALNAGAMIVAHNHPSGHPEPSPADRQITRRLKEALALVDVRIIDHLVVGGFTSVSFAERGLL